jgi:hypothetical protein
LKTKKNEQLRVFFLPYTLVEKKAFNPGLKGPLVPVVATGTNKAGLKAPAFSPGCLRTETNGPPCGPGHVLRLEDLWSRFVTRTRIKGPFGIKFIFFLFQNFCIFFIFFISLISNYFYSYIKLDTYDSHSILMSNYKYL